MKIESCSDQMGLAILLGFTAGIVAIVKLGWKFPFRLARPVAMQRMQRTFHNRFLQQLGFAYDFTHLTYLHNQHARLIISFLMHFGFSITFAVFYCVIAEFRPGITLWQGAAYGLFIWFAFHAVILPLAHTVPPPWHQPFAEHFSKLLGICSVFGSPSWFDTICSIDNTSDA